MEDDDKFGRGYVITISILLAIGVALHVYKDGIQAYLEIAVNVTDD